MHKKLRLFPKNWKERKFYSVKKVHCMLKNTKEKETIMSSFIDNLLHFPDYIFFDFFFEKSFFFEMIESRFCVSCQTCTHARSKVACKSEKTEKNKNFDQKFQSSKIESDIWPEAMSEKTTRRFKWNHKLIFVFVLALLLIRLTLYADPSLTKLQPNIKLSWSWLIQNSTLLDT